MIFRTKNDLLIVKNVIEKLRQLNSNDATVKLIRLMNQNLANVNENHLLAKITTPGLDLA